MEATPEVKSTLVKPMFKKSRKKWLYAGGAVIIVLGVGIPLLLHSMNSATAIPPGDIYPVSYGSVTQTVGTSGTIQVPTEINMNFQGASGVLTSVPVKVGQVVKTGQVLAQLNDSSEKAQLLQAQAGVVQAQGNLIQAQAKLTQAEEGPTSSTLAADQASIDKAQAALTGAKQQYQDQLNQFNDRTSAQQQVVDAQNTLAQAQQQANNTDSLTGAQQQLQSDESTLATDKQALDDAQAQYGGITEQQVQQAYQQYQNLLSSYESWQNGTFVGSNPYTTPMGAANTYYSQLNSGYQSLQQAQQTYNGAQAAVTQDETKVATAKDNLTQLQQQVQQDQQNLQLAQTQYSDRSAAQQTLDNVQNQVQQAEANLESAQASMQQAKQPPDPASVQAAQAAVLTAQAGVESAQAQLQTAQTAEDNTTLKAPINGVVTQVNDLAGEVVSSSTPVAVIDDSVKSDLQVNIQVSESQIGAIQPGQTVNLTVSAFPGNTYHGTILQVYPTPQVVSNVTEYTVIASVDNSSGDLKPGMTADVAIQTAQKNNVLVIPAISLQQRGSLEGVYLYAPNGRGSSNATTSHKKHITGGTGGYSGSASFASVKLPSDVYFEPVKTGLFGTNTVEITAGLQAGEKILLVLPGQAAQTSSSGSGSGGVHLGVGGGGKRGG